MSYYPDTATFTLMANGGIDPNTGYPIEGTAETISLTGRYDASVKSFIKRANDSDSFVPAFVFYMPLEQSNIPEGVELVVNDTSSGRTYKGEVKMFNKGKFNAFALCSNV